MKVNENVHLQQSSILPATVSQKIEMNERRKFAETALHKPFKTLPR